MIVRLLMALWLTTAPFQCASEPDPNRRLEDTPSEVLWSLAEEFRESGDIDAREKTLRRIVERYPDSAEAEMARMTLDEDAPEAATEARGSLGAAPDDGAGDANQAANQDAAEANGDAAGGLAGGAEAAD